MRRSISVISILVTLSLTACNEPTGPTTLFSPCECLSNVEMSFNTRDIRLYELSLSPDFVFFFDPDDVGQEVGDFTIPVSWGYEEDTTAVKNMFAGAYDISCSILESRIDDPPENAETFTAKDVEIRFLLMDDAQHGYIAQGTCDFGFIRTEENGRYIWVIEEWRDFTSSKEIEPISLGGIKAIYVGS